MISEWFLKNSVSWLWFDFNSFSCVVKSTIVWSSEVGRLESLWVRLWTSVCRLRTSQPRMSSPQTVKATAAVFKTFEMEQGIADSSEWVESPPLLLDFLLVRILRLVWMGGGGAKWISGSEDSLSLVPVLSSLTASFWLLLLFIFYLIKDNRLFSFFLLWKINVDVAYFVHAQFGIRSFQQQKDGCACIYQKRGKSWCLVNVETKIKLNDNDSDNISDENPFPIRQLITNADDASSVYAI